jgi:LysR family hydrogen peroxide-inducible transcriptional activator
MARAGRRPLSGPLVLGAIPTIAPFLLPRVIPELRESYPDLKLYLQEEKSAVLYERLMDGSIDAMVLALPWPMRGTETLELFRDPFHLAYREGTTLIDPDNFQINRLTTPSIMLLEDGHCLRDHALAACEIASLDTVNRYSASSLLTLLEMVDADLGVTFVPELAINSGMLKGTSIRTQALGGESYRTIGLAWRSGSGRSKEFALLGDVIRGHA